MSIARVGLSLATGALLLTACSGGDRAPGESDVPPGTAVPLTFRGTLPSADCPGIDLTVTFFPDGTFRLRQVYLDRDPNTTWFDLGTWSEEGAGRLVLRGAGQAPTPMARFGWDSLRMLDGEGRAIGSGPPSGLVRASAVDRVEDDQRLQGMMTYLASAARFTECRSGSSFAIAQEGEYLALERAYLSDRSGPGEPLLVTVRGRLTLHPGMEGGEVPSLVVVAFEGASPGAGCGEPASDRPLEGTEWELADLEGEAPPAGARATLLLDRGALRASGSGGCNQFTGSYDLTGGRLTFGTMASTRRACLGPLMAVEDRYLKALGRVGAYRLMGAGLELLGESGTLARFRAR